MNDSSFFECLETVLEKSNVLNESVTEISASAREGNHEKFCESIRTLSSCVIVLSESSAHAAYLVGVSDPRSDPAIPGNGVGAGFHPGVLGAKLSGVDCICFKDDLGVKLHHDSYLVSTKVPLKTQY